MSDIKKIIKDLRDKQSEFKDSVQITQKSPGLEALMDLFGPELANQLQTPLDFSQGVGAASLPQVAQQNAAQQQAVTEALKQAGVGIPQFDASGNFTGIDTTSADAQAIKSTGPGWQQWFDESAGDISAASTAAASGQDAGLAAIQKAQADADRMSTAAASGQDAGLSQINQAITDATAMSTAATAGQDAGLADIARAQQQAAGMASAATAGQGAADPYIQSAANLSGVGGYQQFMTPYQQEVIDASMAALDQELAQQQANLGASAGSAYGGGRFGVAEGNLLAQGALGKASQQAQLRDRMYNQARDLQAQSIAQQLGLGQAAQAQAAQNVGLYGQGASGSLAAGQAAQQQALQNQGMYGSAAQANLAASQAQQQQALQNQGLYGAASQGQLAGGASAMQQALNNINMLGQTGQMFQGLAQMQPALAGSMIGQLGQIGSQQQAQAQMQMDADQKAAMKKLYEPYDRMGFFGSQLGSLLGGTNYANTTYSGMQQPQAGQGILGLLGGIAGMGLQGASMGMFGGQ